MGRWRVAAVLVGMAGLLLFGSAARAQGQYSKEGAMAIIKTKDWNRLLAYGQAWTQAEPNSADAWYVIGLAYGSKEHHLGLEEPAKALPAFEHAVQLQPQWVDALEGLAWTDWELNHVRRANRAFLQAAQAQPSNTHLWDQVFSTAVRFEAYQEALAAIGNIESHAQNVQDWNMAGTDYEVIAKFSTTPGGAYQKAKEAFERGLQLDPRNGAMWTNLGTAEQGLGNPNAAAQDYIKGAELGNKLGNANRAALIKTIQSCMSWRTQLLHTTVVNGQQGIAFNNQVNNYNNQCDAYTGYVQSNIHIVFVP